MASSIATRGADVGEPGAGKSLASTLQVYVFPASGQAADRQSKDEAECYSWASEKTGHDPFAAAKASAKSRERAEQTKGRIEQGGQGAGVKGAVGGAAVGALIGEIASNDADEGARWGAGLGAIAARRKTRKMKDQAKVGVESQAQQEQALAAEEIESFKKAFSLCLEAKQYMVRY
jgi:hypothetical protein